MRLVPVKADSGFIMDPNDAIKFIDENTIGVIVILGSTFTGHFENVALMSELRMWLRVCCCFINYFDLTTSPLWTVDDLQQRTGLDIPIHVDGASGAFIAPFAHPHLKWNFDVPRVVSINTSGHKFGLVYPGLGWILWRDEKYLHKDLIFKLREVSFSFHEKVTYGIVGTGQIIRTAQNTRSHCKPCHSSMPFPC